MRRLIAFGDSFTYGSDLSDSEFCYSQKTWPALLSADRNIKYQCQAYPGIGNLRVLESILQSDLTNAVCIINWTWIDRFDFCSSTTEQWETLRPTVHHAQSTQYYKHFHGQYADMLVNLIYVKTAIDFLVQQNVSFVMTYMDSLMFESVLPSWHNPAAIEKLQQYVKPYFCNFNDLTFLEWSKKHQFPISENWHPLEQAHQAAFEYLKDRISF